MTDFLRFSVAYDQSGDVLYITTPLVPATKGIEDRHGIVWRYGPDGALLGATIMDFVEMWSDKPEALAHELASHFDIPEPQALNVVEHALEGRTSS
jgi:hypothetical protein